MIKTKSHGRHKQIYNIDVESFIKLPWRAHIYWKDTKGGYLGCNDLSAEKAGVKSRQEIIGISDDDIPYDVSQIAAQQDQKVINTSSEMIFFNTACYDDGNAIDYFTIKSPLKDANGKLIGVFGISHYLSEYRIRQNSIIWHTLQESGVTFSKRQVECLYYLVNGKSYKEIANTIGLSPRTIERYIELTKAKLKCDTQQQLIEKALKLNFIKEGLIFGKLVYPIKNTLLK